MFDVEAELRQMRDGKAVVPTLTVLAEAALGELHVRQDEIERLRAIIDKLPKCWRLNDAGKLVQDVPVVLEMELWRRWPNVALGCESARKHRVKAIYVDGVNLYCVSHGDGYQETPILLGELFSTREAAEAKEKA